MFNPRELRKLINEWGVDGFIGQVPMKNAKVKSVE